MSNTSKHDVFRQGAELRAHRTNEWLTEADITGPLVVFVHGFTAHGDYFSQPAELLLNSGYCTAYFNYDSYVGIDVAGRILGSRLQEFADPIKRFGLVLVAHSMGGLVIRHCARMVLKSLSTSLRGMAMLGTPHDGTLCQRWVLARLLDLGERTHGIDPYLRLPTCRAARQLTRSDSGGFINNLNAIERSYPLNIPTLTVSGAENYLEFGSKKKTLRDWLANTVVQNALGETPNDGLVLEKSANLSAIFGRSKKRTHLNNYDDYSRTNHSALTGNQEIWLRVREFVEKVAPVSV